MSPNENNSKTALKAFLGILFAGILLIVFSFFLNPVNLFFFKDSEFKLSFSDIPSILGFHNKNEITADTITGSIKQDSLISFLNGSFSYKWPDDSVTINELLMSYINTNFTNDTILNKKKTDQFIKENIKADSNEVQKFVKQKLLSYFNAFDEKSIFNPLNGTVRPLDAFFSALLNETDTSLVRVAHYGDSQTEGGRLTINIRKKFQNKFGGSGIGFVPFVETVSNVALSHESNVGWKRFTVFFDRYCNSYYGASGMVFRWAPCSKTEIDSLKSDTLSNNKHLLGLNISKWTSWQKVSLLYGRSEGECIVSVFDDKRTPVTCDTLEPSVEFAMHDLNIPGNYKNLRFEFSSDIVIDFYGLLFDSKKGVQVDNYGIRGHSGDGLMRINAKYFAEQLKKMNTRLIILQFGANAVPYVKNEKECKEIEDSFYTILLRCREVAPKASILLIGTGDMATRVDGEWKSFPILPKFRQAQKNAAIRAGVAFWNLGAAMGGENAILEWTNKKLASNDGHFTPNGQEEVATIFFDALMKEYGKYCSDHNNNTDLKSNEL